MTDSLKVRQIGQGPRRVLALHCTLAHGGTWKGVAEALGTENATVSAPDMVSHGQSPDWDGQGDIADHMSEALAPLLGEATDLIGHSFGAVLALRLALEAPEKIRSLTLVEPVFFAVAKQDDPERFATHETDAAPFAAAMERGDIALATRLFNRMWSDGATPRWPDLPERTRRAMIRGMAIVPASAAFLYEDNAGILIPDKIAGCRAPVTLMTGSRSHPVIPVIAAGLARRLPNARHVQVAGAGHMLPLSHPASVAAALPD